MKLSYSFAAIAVSLLSTTEGLQDKNLRSAVSSISTAASSSSTADADVQKHAGIRHTIRSAAAAYAATPSNDIQRHAQAVNDGYYPSWSTGGSTCMNDGNAPDYMIADGGYHESTLLDCCYRYYHYDMQTCMGSNPTLIEGFYPAWELDNNAIKCLSVTDTPPPSYMVNDPTFWVDYDIETCCTRRYAWAKDTCINASREAAGSSAPVSSPPTCAGKCYTFDSQEGEMTVTNPVNGGCNSDAMCVTTLKEAFPSYSPSRSPSKEPTMSPSSIPSVSSEPSAHSSEPSVSIAPSTSDMPSSQPSASPSISLVPTSVPTNSPTGSPTKEPTSSPSLSPSSSPTEVPTGSPSKQPSSSPTAGPSTTPSSSPSKAPTPAPFSPAPFSPASITPSPEAYTPAPFSPAPFSPAPITPAPTSAPSCPAPSGTSELYCEQFVSGFAASPAVEQAWDTFQASLTGTYSQVTISGSLDSTGVTCSDPVAVNQLANALNTNTEVSVECNGRTWNIGVPSYLEFNSNPLGSTSIGSCPNPGYVVRPKIGNQNWGGSGSRTCPGPSQTILVEFIKAPPSSSPSKEPTQGPSQTNTDGVFDEQFVSGQAVSPAVQLAWDNFLASLTGTYTQVTFSGSLDPTGVTCSDPTAVNALANALNTNAAVSVQCNGRTWSTDPSCGGELSAGGVCDCSSDYNIRANGDAGSTWGTAGSDTCGSNSPAPSQSLRVEFS